MAQTLLSERPILGWPNLSVELHVLGAGNFSVCVVDKESMTHTWVTPDRQEAKDVYFHPFVYFTRLPKEDRSAHTSDG